MNQSTDNELDDLFCKFATGYTRKELLTLSENFTGLDEAEVRTELKTVDAIVTALRQREERLCNAARIDELRKFNNSVSEDPCICSHVNGLVEEHIIALTNKESL